jgi:hypothetical protein
MEDDTNGVNQTVLIQNIFSFPPDFDANNFSNFANGVPYGALPPPQPPSTSEGAQAQGSQGERRLSAAGGSKEYPRSFLAQGAPIPHISPTGLSDSAPKGAQGGLPSASTGKTVEGDFCPTRLQTASLPTILGPGPGETFVPVSNPPTSTGREEQSLIRFDPYKDPLS